MGTPTKLGNESVIAISGSSEFNVAFPTFINFIQSGVATGTTYVSRAKAPLEYSQNLITSLNSALGAGSWELGYFVYKGTTSKVTLTGSSGLFGEIYASRIEVSFTNAVSGGIKTIRFDGRFVIDPYDFRLGSGDSVTKIFIDREPSSSNVIGSEVLDVSLSFGSDGIWSGNLLQHIRSTKKASGDYSGYAYQSTTTFSGVNVNGVSVDQKTTFSDEKVTSNSYKAYGADGKLVYSSIPSSIKAINLETDIGFAQEVALSGNTLISLSGSHTSSVSTYAGDDWVIDASTGSNKIDGGIGDDLVEYLLPSSRYSVTRKDAQTILVSNSVETNELINVETIRFSDTSVTTSTVTTRSSQLTVLVDKGVLGPEPIVIKLDNEEVTTTGTTVTAHILNYNGTKFNYKDVDALLTTVIRDGNFTDEFRKEITDQYPTLGNISYTEAVALVGAANIDAVLISVAGADGNYVG